MSPDILIFQSGKLGDMVLTTPLFFNLKIIFPDSKITVICSRYSSEILRYNKNVDNILIIDKSLSGYMKVFKKLRQLKFDYFIDVNPDRSKTSKIFLGRVRAETSLGYSNDIINFDVNLSNYKNGFHYTELSTASLRFFAPDFTPNLTPKLYFPTSGSTMLKPNVHLNMSAGKKERNWGLGNYEKLLTHILGEYNLNIYINCLELKIVKKLKLKLNSKRLHFHKASIEELVNCIKSSDFAISPDTLAIHIASAFNTPVIGLYNNVEWNYKRFSPLSEKQEVIVSKNKDSIMDISVDTVLESIQRLI